MEVTIINNKGMPKRRPFDRIIGITYTDRMLAITRHNDGITIVKLIPLIPLDMEVEITGKDLVINPGSIHEGKL